jgi:hypothetical protein
LKKQKAKAGGQPGLNSKTLSQKKIKEFARRVFYKYMKFQAILMPWNNPVLLSEDPYYETKERGRQI